MPSQLPCRLIVRDLQRQCDGRTLGPYSLMLEGGQCVVLSGPSGSGKSLLLRMIADLDPNQGELSISAPSAISRAAMTAPAWRQRVTYVAAEAGWWADTLRQHLAAADWPAALGLLQRLGLAASTLDAPIERLSSGERQRCALLRAIVQQPQFLLLDEPSAALDDASTQQLESLLKDLQVQGTGLLVVSHQQAQVQRLADRILHMQDGVLRQDIA